MSSGTTWKPEELTAHPQFKSLVGLKTVPAKRKAVHTDDQPLPESEPVEKGLTFKVPGPPVGKPRMTQRDKWMKRPRVLRYRDYCDRIRAAAPPMPNDVYGVIIQAYLAMPASWSKKKKAEHHGKMQRAKPDFDNIIKSVCDALFKEDSVLGGGTCWKYWCSEGEERTVIRVLYDD